MPPDDSFLMENKDAIIRLSFSVYENPGVYALLLGSGLSRAAGIPTGWEITLDLIRRIALAQEEVDQADWVQWYREKFGDEPSYSNLITKLGPTRHERRSILNSYIEPSEEERNNHRKTQTKAHEAIADLVYDGFIRVIVTTNFDRLLENALRARGLKPTILDSVNAIQGAEPLIHSKCCVVKLHGDYKDARILNTDIELSQYAPEFEALLDQILDEHGLIVCGWSGEWDRALCHAITRSLSRRYSLFWTTRKPIGDTGRRIVEHRRGNIVPIVDADDFFCKLRNKVATLAHTHRRNPTDVQLLVNSAKRFVTKSEYRIELHDLLESETQSYLEKLLNYTPQVDLNIKSVESLIDFQESTTEPLGRILGVLGRWGDGVEYGTVVNSILTLWLRLGDTRSNKSHLNRYPAVLLLWAYGIGLTLAERWADLHALLMHPVSSNSDHPKNLVYVVSKWLLDGYNNEIWKKLPGMQDRYTPDADHFLQVLNRWRDSFAAVHADFESVHDVWEILFALSYRESVPDAPAHDGVRWSPVGRIAWRHRSRITILGQLENTEFRSKLIASGFGGGQDDRLTADISDYVQFVSRLRYI